MVIANLTPSQLKLYFDNSLPEFQKMIDYQLEESTIFRLIVNRMNNLQNDISNLERKQQGPFRFINNLIFHIPSNLEYLNKSYARLEKQHKDFLEAKKNGKLWEWFRKESFSAELSGYDENAILLSDAICNQTIAEVYLDDIKDTHAKLVIEYMESEETGEVEKIEISTYYKKQLKILVSYMTIIL